MGLGTDESRQDNFGHQTANPMTDVLSVPGHHDFNPERLRFYRNGSRVYLQYGDDSHFTETNQGHSLTPDSGDVLTLETAERVSYPVGFDLVPSVAWEVNQAPQSGDVVAGGYGNPDLANFDPAAESYTGTTADGYFWYITEDTGLSEALFAEVNGGTIIDSRRSKLGTGADVWGRYAMWLNYYDVGPCRFVETLTNVAEDTEYPQENRSLTSVANDDGKGPKHGSKRFRMQVKQDGANTGLELEMGSVGVGIPGRHEYLFKEKSHTTTFDVSNTTAGTYEVLGGIRTDPEQPLVKTRILDVEIISTPSSTTEVEVLIIAVDPDSTNLTDSDFAKPKEHSAENSVVEIATSTTATGPDANDTNTDSTGAATAETMTNPGGYQIGRDIIGSQGSGSKIDQRSSGKSKTRAIYDLDWGLVLVDSNEAGNHDVDFVTAQNN